MKHWAECSYKKFALFAWFFKRTLNLLNTRKAFKASSKQSVLGEKIFRRF